MVIANPLYDVVFKRMMENDRVAKFFIGTLLEQTIETVEVKPQEFTYTDELAGLAVFRLDFIATIITDTGERKKVLIEIQKAKNYTDLMRFRNYLAEQYKKEDVINDENVVLPITTIYVLGFTLPEIETACLKVERTYKDLTTKSALTVKSDFVEKLTHDSFIVQADRITDRYQTKLDKLLSIFEQAHFIDDKKIIKEFTHEVDIEEVRITTDILHHSGTNPAERKKIETEQEAWRTLDALTGGLREKEKRYLQELKEKDQALTEIEQALTEKDQALTEIEQALSEKDQALTQIEQALSEKDQALTQIEQSLTEKDQALTEKDQALTEKDVYIAELLRQLDETKKMS
jgi:tetratricopeptide (TPR) repeat protein